MVHCPLWIKTKWENEIDIIINMTNELPLLLDPSNAIDSPGIQPPIFI